MLISCLVYSSILMMEATCSSETSVDFQWTTRRNIPEDRKISLGIYCSIESVLAFEEELCSVELVREL
jgi:hypothetical protein